MVALFLYFCTFLFDTGYFQKVKPLNGKNIKIELSYDSAIPLLGIYPEKNMIQKDTCTPMITAALLTIAKTWKQPKCPLTEEWIKQMWYTYTME